MVIHPQRPLRYARRPPKGAPHLTPPPQVFQVFRLFQVFQVFRVPTMYNEKFVMSKNFIYICEC